MTFRYHILALTFLLLAASACGARSIRSLPPEEIGEVPGEDGPPSERPDGVDPDVSFWIQAGIISQVDLLVQVDNSNSMREEQALLTQNMPLLVDALTDPPDANGDGVPDYPRVASLHIGVISADMGTAGYPIPTCDSEHGDDGVLQHLPSPYVDGCDLTYPSFLSHDAGVGESIDHDFACIATLGTGGCGFEQQLGGIEKAVTVHAAEGGANDGFLRPAALLAILMLTDEDDCTVQDPRIFDLDDDGLGPLNLRCFLNPDMTRPVAGIVENLLNVKPGRPDHTVVAAIIGVPPDLVALSEDDLASDDLQTTADFDDILDDARMQDVIDNSPAGGGNQLVPACDTALGKAFPGRRIVELVREVDRRGNTGVVQSICQADWRPTMRAITNVIQRHLDAPSSCTSSALVNAAGNEVAEATRVACAVYETRYDGGACEGAGKIDRGLHADARICQICQAGDGPENPTDVFGLDVSSCAGRGWVYDPSSAECSAGGKIVFADGAQPDPGSVVYLECKWPAA